MQKVFRAHSWETYYWREGAWYRRSEFTKSCINCCDSTRWLRAWRISSDSVTRVGFRIGTYIHLYMARRIGAYTVSIAMHFLSLLEWSVSKNERINSCNCDFDDLRKYTRKKHKIPNVNAEIARNKVCQLLIKLKFLSTRVTTIAVKTIESTGALKSHIPLSSLFETRLIR